MPCIVPHDFSRGTCPYRGSHEAAAGGPESYSNRSNDGSHVILATCICTPHAELRKHKTFDIITPFLHVL